MKRLLTSVIMLLLCSACQAPLSHVKPPLADEGELFLYMKPFVREARGLRFTIPGIAALRSDGVELPLSMAYSEFSEAGMTRQRLVASGVLPPGAYRGFSVKPGTAYLRGEEGETALRVAEKAQIIDFVFEIGRKKGTVVSLSFRPRQSLTGDSDFSPAFLVALPDKPLPALAGYVTNYGSNTITVFDKRSGEVLEVIEAGQGPRDMVLDPVQRKGYVALSGEDAVAVLDLLTNEVLVRIVLNHGDKPQGLALTPDGRTLLAVNSGSNTVSIIDPAALQETTRISVGIGPGPILLDPAGKKAYVFHAATNSISIIDIANALVAASFATESGPLWGQFSRRGDKLLVTHSWSPNLVIYDTSSLAVLKRIYVGMGVSGLQMDSATDRFYLARQHDAIIDIYDPFSFIPVDFIQAGGRGASYMLIDRQENNLLLILPGEKALQGINLVSKKGAFLLDVGAEPSWATISGER